MVSDAAVAFAGEATGENIDRHHTGRRRQFTLSAGRKRTKMMPRHLSRSLMDGGGRRRQHRRRRRHAGAIGGRHRRPQAAASLRGHVAHLRQIPTAAHALFSTHSHLRADAPQASARRWRARHIKPPSAADHPAAPAGTPPSKKHTPPRSSAAELQVQRRPNVIGDEVDPTLLNGCFDLQLTHRPPAAY